MDLIFGVFVLVVLSFLFSGNFLAVLNIRKIRRTGGKSSFHVHDPSRKYFLEFRVCGQFAAFVLQVDRFLCADLRDFEQFDHRRDLQPGELLVPFYQVQEHEKIPQEQTRGERQRHPLQQCPPPN